MSKSKPQRKVSPIERLAAPHMPAPRAPLRVFAATEPEADNVNHPPHYKRGGLECVDIVEAMADGWEPQTALRLGQAVQYVFRHAHKGHHDDGTQDLRKAIWWIQREIDARLATAGARHG